MMDNNQRTNHNISIQQKKNSAKSIDGWEGNESGEDAGACAMAADKGANNKDVINMLIMGASILHPKKARLIHKSNRRVVFFLYKAMAAQSTKIKYRGSNKAGVALSAKFAKFIIKRAIFPTTKISGKDKAIISQNKILLQVWDFSALGKIILCSPLQLFRFIIQYLIRILVRRCLCAMVKPLKTVCTKAS